MNNIKNLKTHHGNLLQKKHIQRVNQMRHDLSASRARLSVVGQWLDKCADVLTYFDSKLKDQIIACDRTQVFHEQCQQALEQDSVFHMIKVRDRLMQERRCRIKQRLSEAS